MIFVGIPKKNHHEFLCACVVTGWECHPHPALDVHNGHIQLLQELFLTSSGSCLVHIITSWYVSPYVARKCNSDIWKFKLVQNCQRSRSGHETKWWKHMGSTRFFFKKTVWVKHPHPKRFWIFHLQTKQVDASSNLFNINQNNAVYLSNKNKNELPPSSRNCWIHLLSASTGLLSHDSIHGTLQPWWSQGKSWVMCIRLPGLPQPVWPPHWATWSLEALATQRLTKSD